MIDKQKFRDVMLTTAKALSFGAPNFADRDTIETWHNFLNDIDQELFLTTMRKLIYSEDRFPTIRKIRELCAGLESPEKIAEEIWAALESTGRRDKLSIAAQNVVDRCGGWDTLRHTQYSEKPSCLRNWREMAAEVNKNILSGDLKPKSLPEHTKKNRPLSNALAIIEGDLK